MATSNFFSDNADLRFHFESLNLEEVVRLRENDYREEGSPKDFAASQTVFREKLETVGALAGGPILKRSEEADRVGVTIQNNEVRRENDR